MKYQNVIVKGGDDFLGEITLNRPDQMNTFNTEMAWNWIKHSRPWIKKRKCM
jgi:enoyl-CoA hydratase/carnithine racemase